MPISTQILSDVDAVYASGLTIAVVHTYGEDTESLNVFFDEPYDASDLIGVNTENAQTRILVKTSGMTNITADSSFLIDSTTYYVQEIYNDDKGITQIALTKDNVG